MMESPNQYFDVFTLKKPWQNNENTIWLASTVKLHRNIEKFKFPNKLDLDRKKQIIALAGKDLLKQPLMQKASLVKAEDVSVLEKEYLAEHALSVCSFQQSGTGEAFAIDPKGELMAMFNMSDHLNFLAIDTKGSLESSWNTLMKIESGLGKTVAYSYSPKYGFLTSDPAKCGTGLKVMVFLQLSSLVHTGKIDSLLEETLDESFLVTGIQGNPTEIIGDILLLQNNYTLGVTEEYILSTLRTTAAKLVSEEKSERQKIGAAKDPAMMDKVSRAFAILLHSYQIEAIEALNAISLVKLGVDLGWIEGISIADLNLLFFNCRRAHLLGQYQGKISQAEIPHKRAEFIHAALKNAKLLIS